MKQLLLWLIRGYQKYISPHKGFCCAYRHHTGHASCSALGYRVVRRYGVVCGLILLRRRMFLCGVVYRRYHVPAKLMAEQKWLRTQRGDCDCGGAVPCDCNGDGQCNSADCRLIDKSLGNFNCCDACDCDWDKKKRKDEDKVRIPPNKRKVAQNLSDFQRDGCVRIERVVDEEQCTKLAQQYALTQARQAGSRCLLNEAWCKSLAVQLRASPLLNGLLGSGCFAVQCTYFEKSTERNWLVPTHQDLSIPVLEKVDHPELTGWSEKQNELFVQAPVEVLKQLIAVRLHLDVCSQEDGALKVYLGSHKLGRVEPNDAAVLKANYPEVFCVANIGDVVLMRPLLLHASSKATGSSQRRVLHFLFGPAHLPYGLKWRRMV